MIQYPAQFIYDRKDRVFNVVFPDLPGCLTYGATRREAEDNAREALSGYLKTLDMRKQPIPEPSRREGKNIRYIAPERSVGFAITLKVARQQRNLSQGQVAKALNITVQAYQKYENPRKANPQLKTIDKLEQILCQQILV